MDIITACSNHHALPTIRTASPQIGSQNNPFLPVVVWMFGSKLVELFRKDLGLELLLQSHDSQALRQDGHELILSNCKQAPN